MRRIYGSSNEEVNVRGGLKEFAGDNGSGILVVAPFLKGLVVFEIILRVDQDPVHRYDTLADDIDSFDFGHGRDVGIRCILLWDHRFAQIGGCNFCSRSAADDVFTSPCEEKRHHLRSLVITGGGTECQIHSLSSSNADRANGGIVCGMSRIEPCNTIQQNRSKSFCGKSDTEESLHVFNDTVAVPFFIPHPVGACIQHAVTHHDKDVILHQCQFRLKDYLVSDAKLTSGIVIVFPVSKHDDVGVFILHDGS